MARYRRNRPSRAEVRLWLSAMEDPQTAALATELTGVIRQWCEQADPPPPPPVVQDGGQLLASALREWADSLDEPPA